MTKATFYVVFDAEIGQVYDSKAQNWRQGVKRVRGHRLTQSVPGLKGGEIGLKFEVDIPETAFLRLMPTVAIDIAEGFWTSQPMTVHVEEPPDVEG